MQWYFVASLLTILTSSQVKGCRVASCNSLFSASVEGYVLGILSVSLSALAGVYTEFLMTKKNDCLYWKNVQPYTFAWMISNPFEKVPWWQCLFNWYSITTWMVVLNLGSAGVGFME